MRDLHRKKTKEEPGKISAFTRCWERGVNKGGQKEKISEKKEERVSVVSEPLKEKRTAEGECGQQDPTQARTEVKISMSVGVRGHTWHRETVSGEEAEANGSGLSQSRGLGV